MAGTSLPPPRTSVEKLTNVGYQGTLEEITEGLKNFPVTQRQPSSATDAVAHHSNHQPETSPAVETSTRPASSSPPTLSDPESLSDELSASGLALQDPSMNRDPLHGGPLRGQSRPPYGSQETRGGSNSMQTPRPTGGVSLKKAAVRIARPAGPAPGTPSRASAPAPPVVAAPKIEDGHGNPLPTTSAPSAPTMADTISSIEKEEAALEELFARLNSPSLPSTPQPVLKASNKNAIDLANCGADNTNPSKQFSPGVKVEQSIASRAHIANKNADSTNASLPFPPSTQMEKPPKVGAMSIKEEADGNTPLQTIPAKSDLKDPLPKKTEKGTGETVIDAHPASLPPQSVEEQYLHKAAEYVPSLPPDAGPTAELIKNVTAKLLLPYAPSAVLEPDAVEGLRTRYIDAIVSFLHGFNKADRSITKEKIKEILAKGDGNFLFLCAVLAEEGFISIENLDQVVGLGKAIEGVLPKDEYVLSSTPAQATAAKTSLDEEMTAWPVREKRENVPKCRTCYLTGLPEDCNFNKLQALVWGGRIESLQLPKPGSGKAVVKFFTPEECEKYFHATENGITIPGSKNVVVVEKAEGPNSVNDVLAACTDGDATRCVRAYDADEDWGDVLLMKLATRASGGQPKREVDAIKRGKTARGRSFIEFRFANIYNALQFKRELLEDQDWEHCTIGYAPDPCQTASGVHFKDEGDKAKSSGFL